MVRRLTAGLSTGSIDRGLGFSVTTESAVEELHSRNRGSLPRIPKKCRKMNEHDTVVLVRSLPDHGLEAGDVGSIVHVYDAGNGFEVRFSQGWEDKKNEVVWKTPRIQAFFAFFRSGLSNRIGQTRDSRRPQPVSEFDYHIFNLSKRPKNPEKTAFRPFWMFN